MAATGPYARRHCQVSDVDDAVQESLMVISRKVHGLKAAAAFSSWLFTVIKRECRKLERAMIRHDPLDEDLAEHQIASKSDHDLRIDLAAALESLPAHYLEVVLLRDFEELTIAEIAARLGEQPGAIKSRLHRARELVREYMIGPQAVAKNPTDIATASSPSTGTAASIVPTATSHARPFRKAAPRDAAADSRRINRA